MHDCGFCRVDLALNINFCTGMGRASTESALVVSLWGVAVHRKISTAAATAASEYCRTLYFYFEVLLSNTSISVYMITRLLINFYKNFK